MTKDEMEAFTAKATGATAGRLSFRTFSDSETLGICIELWHGGKKQKDYACAWSGEDKERLPIEAMQELVGEMLGRIVAEGWPDFTAGGES